MTDQNHIPSSSVIPKKPSSKIEKLEKEMSNLKRKMARSKQREKTKAKALKARADGTFERALNRKLSDRKPAQEN